MKKSYVITKSMSRAERAELCKKIYTELFGSSNKGAIKDLTEMVNIIKFGYTNKLNYEKSNVFFSTNIIIN